MDATTEADSQIKIQPQENANSGVASEEQQPAPTIGQFPSHQIKQSPQQTMQQSPIQPPPPPQQAQPVVQSQSLQQSTNQQSIQMQTQQLAQQLAQQLSMQAQGTESQKLEQINSMSHPTDNLPKNQPPKVSAQLPTIQSLLQSISPQTNPPAPIVQQNNPPNDQQNPVAKSSSAQQKAVVTQVKLIDELNILDWFKANDIINQIAEKARSSVDSVITVLDPGMKEYLYSGGDINVLVLSNFECQVSSIRDAFQTIFGRATVTSVRSTLPEATNSHPVKLAQGFESSLIVARQKIESLRLNTSDVPQNQVVLVVQPCIVKIIDDETSRSNNAQGSSPERVLLPKWFFTYSVVLDDPVLVTTMHSFSQLVPIDEDILAIARDSKYPDEFRDAHLGFPITIGDLMSKKLRLEQTEVDDKDTWLSAWAGLDCNRIIYDTSASLASLYKRRWKENVNDCQ